MHVSSGFLPARISRKPRSRTSPNSLHMYFVAVARSFSGSGAIRCVLPVLWMTSYFLIIGPGSGTTLQQQPRCNVVSGITSLLRGTGCVLRPVLNDGVGAKTR